MNHYAADGFYWDSGPSVITMRHVFEDLFAAAGRCLNDYVTLEAVEPLTRYFYHDGTVLDATRDLSRMVQQIAEVDERDVEGYLAYLAFAARVHRITGPVFIYGEPPTPRSFTQVPLPDYFRVGALETLDRAIRRHVRSPHLRQLLGRFATYVGASPYQAPATLSVIAHVELAGGVWYPRGGIYALAAGLARLARELGVSIHTSCCVESILVEDGRARGVVLGNGEEVRARAVVANVDVTTTYRKLLPPSIAPARRMRKLAQSETSCSGFVLLLGVEGESENLAHHNIFFSRDYRREFDDIFQRGVPPDDPTLYVNITAKSDPDHAPPGCENWFVLVNAPPTESNFDWTHCANDYRERILHTLAGFGLDVRARIRSERMLTPVDIARISGAWRGALYGISSNQPLNAFRRPHNRCPDLRGLYFVGGTTHPGGGVPMVALSGKVAANLIQQDLAGSVGRN
jgi:phytoene desaturase